VFPRSTARAASSTSTTPIKAHEIDDLYVADTSVFPSIGAVNPALTAMADAPAGGRSPAGADGSRLIGWPVGGRKLIEVSEPHPFGMMPGRLARSTIRRRDDQHTEADDMATLTFTRS
jgi:hypothetical protein